MSEKHTLKLIGKYFIFLILAVSAQVVTAQPAKVPVLSTTLFTQATEKYRAGDYDSAIAGFTSYLKIRADDPSGWYNRGLCHYYKTISNPTREGYERAASDFSQAIKLAPANAENWLFRGHVYAKLVPVDFERSLPLAIADYTKAISLDPNLAEAYSGRGRVYEESNDLDKSLTDLDTAIRLNQKDATAFYTRGKIHAFKKNFAAARSDLQAALKIHPAYEAAQGYLKYVDEQELKARTAASAQPTTARPAAAATAALPASNSIGPAAANIPSKPVAPVSDPVGDAYKLAEDAAKRGEHAKVVENATRALNMIPLQGKPIPADEITTMIYSALLAMRARSNSILGKYSDSDADYKNAGMAALSSTLRYMDASNKKLVAGKGSYDGGLIMAGLDSATAVTACQTGLKTALQWMSEVKRTRPDDIGPGLQAAVTVMGLREMCAKAHMVNGGNQAASVQIDQPNKAKHLNAAAASYSEAIILTPRDPEPYLRRAKVYRTLGLVDLAQADERKAASLPPVAGN